MMLQLDIGCGGRGTMYDGFIGIDIHPEPKHPRRPGSVYMELDFLCDDLPWQDETVDFAIALHIIEHLIPVEGIMLIERAYKLLKPGAQLIVACPDLRLFCERYLAGDIAFYSRRYTSGKEMWPGDTLADRLNYQIHQASHRWAYDQESLINAARKAGCKKVEPLPKDHPWCKRPDHEIGIIITK